MINSHLTNILNKVIKNNHTVGILGLGYVGLPLVKAFASKGIRTFGFDIDRKKIELLNQCKSPLSDSVTTKDIQSISKSTSFHSSFNKISSCDLVILCVPTPLNDHRDPDISFIQDSMLKILPFLREGQALSLESTTYPGTTREILANQLSNQGFDLGKNFFLIYSPEREDPGNLVHENVRIPKLISGFSNNCLKAAESLYGSAISNTVSTASPEVAEFAKLLENIYRTVNIGLVNEMKIIADKMNIDIYEVIDAAATKPFGFQAFYPGPGIGGHCIPIDPHYLAWKARSFGVNPKFIELSAQINNEMPDYVIEKISLALNSKYLSIKKSKILLLGVSYKKNIADYRESPSFEIWNKLLRLGAKVSYSDPHVKRILPTRKHNLKASSVKLNSISIKRFDLVVLLTDHDSFDYKTIYDHSSLIVDSRNVFKKKGLFSKSKVFVS